MGKSGARKDGNGDARKTERLERHGRLQQLLILSPILIKRIRLLPSFS
jgi:hypothetical protein